MIDGNTIRVSKEMLALIKKKKAEWKRNTNMDIPTTEVTKYIASKFDDSNDNKKKDKSFEFRLHG